MKESVKNRKSVLYETTPIHFKLPAIGSRIRVFDRTVNGLYERDHRISSEFTYKSRFGGAELEVLYYTHGIENPLDNFNKCICKRKVGDLSVTVSLPTVQLSIGTLRYCDVFDEEQTRELKRLSRQA